MSNQQPLPGVEDESLELPSVLYVSWGFFGQNIAKWKKIKFNWQKKECFVEFFSCQILKTNLISFEKSPDITLSCSMLAKMGEGCSIFVLFIFYYHQIWLNHLMDGRHLSQNWKKTLACVSLYWLFFWSAWLVGELYRRIFYYVSPTFEVPFGIGMLLAFVSYVMVHSHLMLNQCQMKI